MGHPRSLRRLALVIAIGGAGAAMAGAPTALAQIPDAEGRIAFARTALPSSSGCCEKRIFTTSLSGSDVGPVTPARGAPAGDSGPRYSPEGLRLAFVSQGFNPDCVSDGPPVAPCFEHDIYVMLANGLFPSLLTYDPDVHVSGPGGPTWHPSGERIAYAGVEGDLSKPDTSIDLFSTRVVGLETENVTRSPGLYELQPDYSPDGRQIAFVGTQGSEPFALYVVDADGEGRRRIAEGLIASDPEWSPDGDRIVFGGSTSPGSGSDIYAIRPDGTSLSRITTEPSNERQPSYSPDGTRIVFAADRELSQTGNPTTSERPQEDLFAMNADGTNQVSLVGDRSAADGYPDWGEVLSGVAPPLPVPPAVAKECPGAETKLSVPATGLKGRLEGGPGPDIVLSGPRARSAGGAAGSDCLFARRGQDILGGGPGPDVLSGGAGSDRIDCGPGRDRAIVTGSDVVAKNCERVVNG